ncbi:hypothetical protein BG000_008064 [Podila horticola]|nr:hypothetical protein BG000_008064 [Podila horticola]
MDKKKPIPPPTPWSPSDEQEFFGNQAPFASTGDIDPSPVGTSRPPTAPGPSHPQQVFNPDDIPQDAPPMYTEQPMRIPSAPQVYPEQSESQLPQSGIAHVNPQPQQPYYGQPSYGAIPSSPQYTPNHHGYRPIPRDEDDSNEDSSSEDEHDRRARRRTGSLDIVTTAGTIKVKMNNNLATFRTIALTSTLGDIILDGVHVQKNTSVQAVKGNVSGVVKTTGKVKVEVGKGTINLSVDDAPDIHGIDSSTLDVKLSTGYGTIDLKQVRRFQGHFLLTTGVGKLAFKKSSRYRDEVHYTSDSARQLAGWIAKDGEPNSLLPRIELKTVVGNVKATIQDPPSKK